MTTSPDELIRFREQVESEWFSNIAPFWLKYSPDEKYGGFHGWITNDLQIDERAEKGIILNSRILWTFSHACKLYGDIAFLQIAQRAYDYLAEYFIDQRYGGVFWTLDYQGHPSDRKKRVYAQAFALYALTEFYVATSKQEALAQAFEIFNMIENRCRDNRHDGYFETFEEDWSLATDQRLSEVDQDEKKSMNTHLHILEAYSTLYRASGNAQVKERLHALINIFLARIIHSQASHLQMFFDETWASRSEHISFGHDIEASWLLCEAAEALGDSEVLTPVRSAALNIAQSVYEKALDADGSLFYEAQEQAIIDDNKHWWAQAEAIVGFVNAYQLSGSDYFLTAAMRVWDFIGRYIIDKKNGEWFWAVSRAGEPSVDRPKLSQWKCPYHNSRMCFEISHRLTEIKESSSHESHRV